MDSVNILGKTMPIGFDVGTAWTAADRAAILAGVGAMAALINSAADAFTAEDAAAYRGMDRITFFVEPVTVNGYSMSRSCCDEDDRIFYWEVEEFDRNPQADVRAATFFHDCWHVVQFKRDRGFAKNEAERAAREVEAVDRQLVIAGALGCDDHEITHWRMFRNDQEQIVARLAEGVHLRREASA